MNSTGVVAGLTIVLLTCAGHATAGGLQGSWTGTVTQEGPGDERSTYPMKMRLRGNAGTIDYPSLACGGKLTYLGLRDGMYRYRETLTYGLKECIDGGLVTLTINGRSLSWVWQLDDVQARALLDPGR